MKISAVMKEVSFNASISYPLEYAEAMRSARKEAQRFFRDFDAIIIAMKFLTGDNSKIKLTCKNNYSKQLKNEIKKIFNI